MASGNAEPLTKAETTASKPSGPEHIEAMSGTSPSVQRVQRDESVRAHWKCLAACLLVSLCPFQYGVDFGCIGGLQAMPGFLEVCFVIFLFFFIFFLENFNPFLYLFSVHGDICEHLVERERERVEFAGCFEL